MSSVKHERFLASMVRLAEVDARFVANKGYEHADQNIVFEGEYGPKHGKGIYTLQINREVFDPQDTAQLALILGVVMFCAATRFGVALHASASYRTDIRPTEDPERWHVLTLFAYSEGQWHQRVMRSELSGDPKIEVMTDWHVMDFDSEIGPRLHSLLQMGAKLADTRRTPVYRDAANSAALLQQKFGLRMLKVPKSVLEGKGSPDAIE